MEESDQANVAAVRRWFQDVWNEGREQTIDDLSAEDELAHGLGPEPIVGPQGFKPVFHTFHNTFSEMSFDMQHCVGKGGYIFLHGTFRAVCAETRATAHIQGARGWLTA